MKKKPFKFLTLVLILYCFSARSQETPDLKISEFTFYLNGFYHFEVSSDDYNSLDMSEYYIRDEKYEFGNPSIAFEIDKGRFIAHEFELMPIDIEHDNKTRYRHFLDTNITYIVEGGISTTIQSTFRYQATHYFFSGELVQPYLALSSQLFYDFSRFKPRTVLSYQKSQNNVGLLFSVIPGIQICLTKKLALDINIPLAIYDIRFVRSKNSSPMLSDSDREKAYFENNFIPDFAHVRIGISYEIN
jgi:hypothetical protein